MAIIQKSGWVRATIEDLKVLNLLIARITKSLNINIKDAPNTKATEIMAVLFAKIEAIAPTMQAVPKKSIQMVDKAYNLLLSQTLSSLFIIGLTIKVDKTIGINSADTP